MATRTLGLLLLTSAVWNLSMKPMAAVISVPPRVLIQAGRGEAAAVFAVYLVADAVDFRVTGSGKGDWSRVRLSDPPLISGDDIIAYDFSKHSMRVRREALARVARVPNRTPFVVVARGQRIYLGVCVGSTSSATYAVPTIVTDGHMFDPTQLKDTIVIDRAYPSPSFGAGPDPRGDERIRTALIALHKLQGDEKGTRRNTATGAPPNPALEPTAHFGREHERAAAQRGR